MGGMTTDALIRGLRMDAGMRGGAEKALLLEAADRLEEMDERIAIMSEGNKAPAHVLAGPDDYDDHRYSGLISEE